MSTQEAPLPVSETFVAQIAPHIARILGELESRLAYLPLLGVSKKRRKARAEPLSDFDRRERIARVRLGRLLEKANLGPEQAVEKWAEFDARWRTKRYREDGTKTADGVPLEEPY